jgi:16S rRNA (guanine527-N7)-methyltransferase
LSRLKKQLQNININLDDQFYDDCEKFSLVLKQWNKTHNLTGACENEDIEKNIIDSVYPISFICNVSKLVDIGTGAGYPGLILAIALRDTKCILVEPRVKRVGFLNYVKNLLKLKNVEVIQKRVEDIQIDNIDLITSRAVTNTKLLIDLTKHISSDKTKYLFYKGSLLQDELEELDIDSYEVVNLNERNYLYIKGNNDN